jgi:hypothetical protein
MLNQNNEIGYVRWWHDKPMDLSNHMAQIWQMSAEAIIRQKQLFYLPDTHLGPLEARSVYMPQITSKQLNKCCTNNKVVIRCSHIIEK